MKFLYSVICQVESVTCNFFGMFLGKIKQSKWKIINIKSDKVGLASWWRAFINTATLSSFYASDIKKIYIVYSFAFIIWQKNILFYTVRILTTYAFWIFFDMSGSKCHLKFSFSHIWTHKNDAKKLEDST